jgi:hypothetical protein
MTLRRGSTADHTTEIPKMQRLTTARMLVPVAASLIVFALGVWALTPESPLMDVTRYLLVWFVFVIVPGVLLWRALAGHSSAEIELAAGAVTGIAVLFVCWLLATALQHPLYAVLGPVLVLAAFAGRRSLRRHWFPARTAAQATRWPWWVAMAVLSGLAIHRLSLAVLRPTVLPPGTNALSADTWYCLGIAQQLQNGFPVADPTFSGGKIKYHWFSLAVITATSQIARTDLVPTVLHLWFVPFVVIWLAVVSGVVRVLVQPYEGRQTPARWWGWGPVAAALVVVFPAALLLHSAAGPALSNGLNSGSASGAFGGLFVSALAIPVCQVVRGTAQPGTYVVLVLLVVVASGIKPTVVPLVAAGCLLVAGLKVLRRDRSWWPPAVLAVLGLVVYSLAGQVVIGSSEGVRVQPFAIVVSDRSYPLLFAGQPRPLAGAGGFLLPAIEQHRPGAVPFVLAILFLFLMGQLLRLVGVLALPFTPVRTDPALWWCAGVVVAGYVVTFLVLHSGFSQQWFALNVSGVSIALTVAVVALTWPREPSRTAVALGVASAVSGLTVGALSLVVGAWLMDEGQRPSMIVRVAPYAVLLVVLALWTRLTHLRFTAAAPPSARLGRVAVTALFLVGAVLPSTTTWVREGRPIPITTNPAAVVSQEQQAAALWLNRNSGPRDVVVSNVFCRPVPYRQNCDHQTVWVSALTGRRLVLDGWIYTPQSAAQYDGTTPMSRMRSPFPERLALSLTIVRRPTERALCEASSQYGARWIFADRQATSVSPALAEYADLRFSNSAVDVYEINPSRISCSSS